MAPGNDTTDRMIEAALALASERGWRTLSLADIAARAGVALVEAYRSCPDKIAILARMIGETDRAVLAQGAAAATDSPRDRMFEILMRRFDALQSRREGMVAILRDLASDPAALLCLSPRLERSMAWMLESAGISSSGCAGSIKAKGLTLVYLDALRVWMKDDNPDMARTMAALDKGLRRAEQVVRSLPVRWLRRGQRRSPCEPPFRTSAFASPPPETKPPESPPM